MTIRLEGLNYKFIIRLEEITSPKFQVRPNFCPKIYQKKVKNDVFQNKEIKDNITLTRQQILTYFLSIYFRNSSF